MAQASAPQLSEGVAAVTAAASTRLKVAHCSRLAAQAAHSPSSDASSNPGANTAEPNRWQQAAATAPHRKAERCFSGGKRYMANPSSAASTAVPSTALVWDSVAPPPASTSESSSSASSVPHPSDAAGRNLPGHSRRPATAAATAPASRTHRSMD